MSWMVIKTSCPPQIQLQSKRTGAVLMRRMKDFQETCLTKLAQINIHNILVAACVSQKGANLKLNNALWRTGGSWWPSMMFISILYVISSKFCKVSFLRFFCLPHQDCTRPLALKVDLWRTGVSWWPSMIFISIVYVILSKFCKASFLKIFHSPHQDCTCPPAL